MDAIAAALTLVGLVAAELAAVYWISRRTGLFRWALGVLGPPRRTTRLHTRMHRLGAICLCVVLISIPLQGGVIIIAGILAAVGLL